MKDEPTHILFEGDSIILSPNLNKIFHFLMEIEKEVKTVMHFNETITDLRTNYQEVLNFIESACLRMQKNNINFDDIEGSDCMIKMADLLVNKSYIRSEFIVLFSYLEVLLCLDIIYECKIVDEDEIRKKSMDTELGRKFINKFLLSKGNNFFYKNRKRLGLISATKIRKLRNSLIHFFSVDGGIGLTPEAFDKDARKIEAKFKKEAVLFISSQDLLSLISDATRLLIKNWSNDFLTNPENFKKSVHCVKEVIDHKGAVLLMKTD